MLDVRGVVRSERPVNGGSATFAAATTPCLHHPTTTLTRAAGNCLSTSRSSSCRWGAFLHQLSPTLPTTAHQDTPTNEIALQTPTGSITTTTTPTTNEKTNNPRRKQNLSSEESESTKKWNE